MADEPHELPQDMAEVFEIARAGLQASELRADLEELREETDLVVIARVVGEEGFRTGSASRMAPEEHLALMVEATQRFAKGLGIELTMIYGAPQQRGQG